MKTLWMALSCTRRTSEEAVFPPSQILRFAQGDVEALRRAETDGHTLAGQMRAGTQAPAGSNSEKGRGSPGRWPKTMQ